RSAFSSPVSGTGKGPSTSSCSTSPSQWAMPTSTGEPLRRATSAAAGVVEAGRPKKGTKTPRSEAMLWSVSRQTMSLRVRAVAPRPRRGAAYHAVGFAEAAPADRAHLAVQRRHPGDVVAAAAPVLVLALGGRLPQVCAADHVQLAVERRHAPDAVPAAAQIFV